MAEPSGHSRCRSPAALWALLALAAALSAWNAYTIPALAGYDVPGHAGYVLTIVEDGRLPHPLEGWSTFHPPLYYLLASVVWRLLRPLGPQAVVVGLRALGAMAGLAVGWVTFHLVRRLGGTAGVAWIAAALALFVPCSQMAAAMIGNEAFAAGVAALALPSLLRLHADPTDVPAALRTGLLAGLAATAKFTGLWVAGACALPFLRKGSPPRRRRLVALATCLAAGALLTSPVYLRNLMTAGALIPMTRELQPMRGAEAWMILRQRRLADYLRLDPNCLTRPSVFHVAGAHGSLSNRNRAMTNVWGLTYASTWYDAFAQRIPLRYHRDGASPGPVLALLGLVPTAVMLFGLVAAGRDLLRHGARSPDAPLVVMTLLALSSFVRFTWIAPSMAAVKGSYLLPLAAPAGVFFARGAGLLGPKLRTAVLLLSGMAAVAAAIVFTNRLLIPTEPMGPSGVNVWLGWSAYMPSAHIGEAIRYLADTATKG
jgi:hypothetical protein